MNDFIKEEAFESFWDYVYGNIFDLEKEIDSNLALHLRKEKKHLRKYFCFLPNKI